LAAQKHELNPQMTNTQLQFLSVVRRALLMIVREIDRILEVESEAEKVS